MKIESMARVVAAYRSMYDATTAGKTVGANGDDFGEEDTEARAVAFEVACEIEPPTSKDMKLQLEAAVNDLLDAET